MALSEEQRAEVLKIAQEAATVAYTTQKAEADAVLANIKAEFEKVYAVSEDTLKNMQQQAEAIKTTFERTSEQNTELGSTQKIIEEKLSEVNQAIAGLSTTQAAIQVKVREVNQVMGSHGKNTQQLESLMVSTRLQMDEWSKNTKAAQEERDRELNEHLKSEQEKSANWARQCEEWANTVNQKIEHLAQERGDESFVEGHGPRSKPDRKLNEAKDVPVDKMKKDISKADFTHWAECLGLHLETFAV